MFVQFNSASVSCAPDRSKVKMWNRYLHKKYVHRYLHIRTEWLDRFEPNPTERHAYSLEWSKHVVIVRANNAIQIAYAYRFWKVYVCIGSIGSNWQSFVKKIVVSNRYHRRCSFKTWIDWYKIEKMETKKICRTRDKCIRTRWEVNLLRRYVDRRNCGM